MGTVAAVRKATSIDVGFRPVEISGSFARLPGVTGHAATVAAPDAATGDMPPSGHGRMAGAKPPSVRRCLPDGWATMPVKRLH